MHNPYVVRTGGFDWFGLKDENSDLTDRILGLAGLRIELTWTDQSRELPHELRPRGRPAHRAEYPLYELKLIIERSRHSIRGHGPRDSLTVNFSEGYVRDGENCLLVIWPALLFSVLKHVGVQSVTAKTASLSYGQPCSSAY
jgi:hypothetical protein